MALQNTTTQQELLFKQRTGESFAFFYEKFYPRLVYNINGITQDEYLAEDVATEAFIKAFEKIDQYEKGKAQFSTWLFTIARHLALQELKQSRKTMSIDNELDEEGTTMKDFIQDEEDNDEFLNKLNIQKAEIMKREIQKLKEPFKTVIEMREIKKMQYKDIADILGRNLSTVKSQIRNGRAILIKNTEKEFKHLEENLDEVDFLI
jgi:RNA polymerase sigma-70 factor (ECF subfamily)